MTRTDVLETLEEYINSALDSKLCTCVSVGAGTSDQLWCQAYGIRAFAPAQVTDVYDFASITKAYVAKLSLKLIGIENLDQKVIDVLPMTGKYRDLITLRHLMQYGVDFGDRGGLHKTTTPKEFLDEVLHGDLMCPPEEKTFYTNISPILMGLYLEKKFNQKLDILLHDHLFKKIKSYPTFKPRSTYHRESIIQTELFLPVGIVQDEGARIYGNACGAAGLFGTIHDLLKLGQSFLGDDTFLPKNVIQEMVKPQLVHVKTPKFGLGMGLRHNHEFKYDKPVLKRNAFAGGHFSVLPFDDFTFSILANINYPTRANQEKKDQFSKLIYNLQTLVFDYKDIFFEK